MMQAENLAIRPGMKAAVIGLGLSGRACLKYLLTRGVRVAASDLGDGSDDGLQELLALEGVSFEFGRHSIGFFAGCDFAVAGPGVPLESEIILQLRECGIPVVGELGLLAGEFDCPLIAVTGTNGKTTVTELLGTTLTAAGLDVFAGGNLGTPACEYFLQGKGKDAVILEVSSFQLDLAGEFRPHIGILLNISPDHLDRHGSMDNYIGAKKKLFDHQGKDDFAIIGSDVCGGEFADFGQGGRPRLLRFGCGSNLEAAIDFSRSLVSFGGEEYHLADTALVGHSGLLNAAPAIMAAALLGCPHGQILAGLKSFRPLAHRLEYVAEINGVSYYNDSKATNTGAVIEALSAVDGKKVILIAGGRDKGDDYTLLRKSLEEKVKTLILMGEAAPVMEKKLDGSTEILRASSLEEAVVAAAAVAAAGEVVMLSPACASFDMFENYRVRGETFKHLVQKMAEGHEGK
ncbi:MAG: UDP-N-acetylmuramoyl-L-alanine--D-glutamate ligase [Deltaproteobacteria bacterium]|nr:MAG: UDP-N-acetylmuramoyl-L-alanine--D-glutamate ligase [Deltaproteobacteria bacterium]